jgi:hypothetical protein
MHRSVPFSSKTISSASAKTLPRERIAVAAATVIVTVARPVMSMNDVRAAFVRRTAVRSEPLGTMIPFGALVSVCIYGLNCAGIGRRRAT